MFSLPEPDTIRLAIGAGFSIMAIAFVFLSMFKVIRSHTIRVAAILIVFAIALFSDHWSTYFAAVFIVATAVTELGFLQNLAAIIRGNKEYFQFQRELLTRHDLERMIAIEEEVEAESVRTEVAKIVKQGATLQDTVMQLEGRSLAFAVEQLALKHVELRLGGFLHRNVRLRGERVSFVFDGIHYAPNGRVKTVIEVKLITHSHAEASIPSVAAVLSSRMGSFMRMIGHSVNIQLAVVVPDSSQLLHEGMEAVHSELRKLKPSITLVLLDFADIGFGSGGSHNTIKP